MALDSSSAATPWELICPPSQGVNSIKQVCAPARIACEAAAIPPKEPPITTTSHSHTCDCFGGGGLSNGQPCGVVVFETSIDPIGDTLELNPTSIRCLLDIGVNPRKAALAPATKKLLVFLIQLADL